MGFYTFSNNNKAKRLHRLCSRDKIRMFFADCIEVNKYTTDVTILLCVELSETRL